MKMRVHGSLWALTLLGLAQGMGPSTSSAFYATAENAMVVRIVESKLMQFSTKVDRYVFSVRVEVIGDCGDYPEFKKGAALTISRLEVVEGWHERIRTGVCLRMVRPLEMVPRKGWKAGNWRVADVYAEDPGGCPPQTVID